MAFRVWGEFNREHAPAAAFAVEASAEASLSWSQLAGEEGEGSPAAEDGAPTLGGSVAGANGRDASPIRQVDYEPPRGRVERVGRRTVRTA